MAKLGDLASLIRSKNAGPFVLTFDVLFDDPETYRRVRDSAALSAEVVAALYDVAREDVRFFFCDNALAIKASIPRPVIQGDIGDADGHGGQQFAPLIDIEIE